MDGRQRSGVAAWVAAGAAFAAYPIVRPAGDSGADWASPAWLVAHLLAVAGFGLLVAGLAALRYPRPAGSAGCRPPRSVLRDGPGERAGFAAVVTGGAGAVLVLPAWTGWLLAAGFVLYLPQFFAPAWLRVVHGVLVAAGCIAIAWHLSRVDDSGRVRTVEPAGAVA